MVNLDHPRLPAVTAERVHHVCPPGFWMTRAFRWVVVCGGAFTTAALGPADTTPDFGFVGATTLAFGGGDEGTGL